MTTPRLQDLDLAGNPADHRIVVAMSGGVDSSVTAALLVERGFEVVGITLQLYDHGAATGRKGACCAGRDIGDARRVAERLGIAHYVLDYESRFRREVIEDFAETYRRGETPIPCIRCNQRIKFRDLLGTARDLGCLRTRHRALCAAGDRAGRTRAAPGGRCCARPELFSVRDDARGTRFLALPAGRARQGRDPRIGTAFRLGGRRQAGQPRYLLCSAGFLRAARRSSSGRRRASPGTSSTWRGRVLGRHRGIAHFTVGQRKGLGRRRRRAALRACVSIPEERRVVVGPRAALAETRLSLGEVNWLGPLAAPGMAVAAKLRSAQPPVPATLYRGGITGRGRSCSRRPRGRGGAGPGRRALRRRARARRRLDPAAGGRRGLTRLRPSPICEPLAAG